MNFEKVLPIVWVTWDGDAHDTLQFNETTFTEDFGPFKKGDKVDCLCVSMNGGLVTEYSSSGEQLRTVKVKFVATEEHYLNPDNITTDSRFCEIPSEMQEQLKSIPPTDNLDKYSWHEVVFEMNDNTICQAAVVNCKYVCLPVEIVKKIAKIKKIIELRKGD